MRGWCFCLSLLWILLCVTWGNGQEITTEENIIIQEEQAASETQAPPSRIIFPKDRKPSSISTRIIGGNVAAAHAYPYQAALYILVEGVTYFCGGTLITPEWLLTAAHCVDGASSAEVILGAHDITQTETTQIVLNSSIFVIHQGWNESILQNDIALIRLPQNVTLGDNINTVPLAEGSNTYTGILGRCLGWGRTIVGLLSSVLRYVDAEVMTNEKCRSYEDYTPYIVDHHLCTSGEGMVGSCNGDSGGPLIINGNQVGVVSFGVTDCAAGMPSVFTRVTEFHSWIQATIGNWTEEDNTGNPGGNGGRIEPFIQVYIGILFSIMFLNYL